MNNILFIVLVIILIIGLIIYTNNSKFSASSATTGTGTSNYVGFTKNSNPPGPFLLPDPGSTQPVIGQQPSMSASNVTYINTLGIPSVTSNISPPVGFIWPSQGKTYTYSPTCISGIPNNYLYSTTNKGITTITGSVTLNALTTKDDRVNISPDSSLFGGGEYGIFNAYFQYDKYASAFMNNDQSFVPFSSTSSGNGTYKTNAVDLRNLKGVYFYSFFNNFNENYFADVPRELSFNDAIGIPADFVISALDSGKGNSKGTPGFALNSLTGLTKLSNSQIFRAKVIAGVLTSMHSFISKNIKSPVEQLLNYKSNILDDLKNYYPVNKICQDTNFNTKNKTFYVSENTSLAIYLTLLARDSWISNQILNVNFL